MPIIVKFQFYDLDPSQVKSWFCILFLIVIQTSYLTPPMAPAIFYLRGIRRKTGRHWPKNCG